MSRLWRGQVRALSPWAPDHATSLRLALWESRATRGSRATLALDAALQRPPVPADASLKRWVLADGTGHALCPAYPLLAAICGGQGLHLTLNQQQAITDQWSPLRSLHLGVSSHYAAALLTLPHAVQRLVQQAVRDSLLSDQRLEGEPTVVVRPAPLSQRPWWVCLRGMARAQWNLQKTRLLSEYWRIGVLDAPVHSLLEDGPVPEVRWITTATARGYWADPFGLPADPSRLACEFFDERTGVGSIEILQFDAADRVVEHTRMPISTDQHASFPNVFEMDGRQLGISETIASRECVLHEVDACGHWRPLFTLLDDVAAADPALFVWEGRYWLAYTDNDMGNLDNLCLRYADQLEGPWMSHHNNPVKVDITGARMAGGLFSHNGALYRPAQSCLQTYGAAITIFRITELSPSRFSEVAVRTLVPDALGPCPHGMHTLNAWGDRTLVDGKRHGINLIAKWRTLRQRFRRLTSRAASERPGHQPVSQSAPRHVAVYVPHLHTGGGEISMLRLAAGFAAAGVRVDLVVNSLSRCELAVPDGVQLVNLNSGGTAAAVWRLSRWLRECQPNVLVSAFPHSNVAAVVACALSGTACRCVVTEHAPLSLQIKQQGSWRYRLLPPIVRWAYRRAHAVVAVSGGVRIDLQRLLGHRVVCEVISNPVLQPDFSADMARLPDHSWLTDASVQVVLSVGRLSVEKDVATLLHAFAEVHRLRPTARLLVAGEGPDRARLELLVKELGLSEVVRLPGRTDSPLAWMCHAAVFVLASQYEGFGNVLVEAMACGTPVVSTDCPVGPHEILQGGRLGALVPVGDAAAMARAILDVLANPVAPKAALEAALGYTQTAACDKYLALFQRCLRDTA